jgi:hypothetical protein
MQSPKTRDKFSALAGGPPQDRPGTRTVVTTDHDAIMKWAAAHSAEPATGEATPSGPAVRTVRDEGPGIRFNFPGFAPFRPIAWTEWLDNFDRHQLAFVYEEEDDVQVAHRAHTLWESRGQPEGDPAKDWFEAEHDLERRSDGAPLNGRYTIVKRPAT